MNKKTLKEIDVSNKKVLVRVDFNVSLSNSQVVDDTRISQTVPTIEYLLKNHCTVLLLSHLGRPGGKRVKELSLKPVAGYLEKILNRRVNFVEEYVDKDEAASKIRDGGVNLLENVRFYPGEEANETEFSRKLAGLANVYVNDAFGVDHRVAASTVGITQFLPAVAGLLLEKEVKVIGQLMVKPERPFIAIIGGAKMETKIGAMEKLIEKTDEMLVGGAVGNTFMAAAGQSMKQSLIEPQMLALAKKLLQTGKVIIPVDGVWEEDKLLDIGPKTQAEFGARIAKAATIIWNGPMGMFEDPKFSGGTDFVYEAISKNRDSLSIVGGGETLTALQNKDCLKTIDHVSTGGGAMLMFIEKGTLPGIEVLMDK